MTAIAAMMPVCMLQNIAQPQRKPTAGENVLAQEDVDAAGAGECAEPARRRSARRPGVSSPGRSPDEQDAADRSGTARVISDGCTKIEAPMMMPTTSAVARTSPMARGNERPGGAAGVARLTGSARTWKYPFEVAGYAGALLPRTQCYRRKTAGGNQK